MAVDTEKFLKAKRFTTDHTLDDATDQVLVKTTAGSSVGDAIAAATGAQSLATAIAADAAAQTTLATALADNLGASAAETIAGTEAAKFVSPDDMKAALGSGSNYPINIVNPAALSGTNLGAAIFGESNASGTASQTARFLLTGGTVGTGLIGFTSAVVGAAYPSVSVPSGMRIQGVMGAVSSVGAGTHVAVGGETNGISGGTNIGVFGIATGGAINWAGYFNGNVYGSNALYLATNANPFAARISMSAGSGEAAGIGINASSGASFQSIVFGVTGASVGNINQSSTGVAYNSISDYRLKTVDGPVTNSGAFIDALKPVTGEWKAEPGKKANFFLAHEVQEVSPSSVQGTKDAVDAGGNPVMQSMEYGSADFIVNMIAELQDLRKRVAALEGAVLEGAVL